MNFTATGTTPSRLVGLNCKSYFCAGPKEARAARVAAARRGLAELKSFDRASLDSTHRISAAILERQLDDIVRGEPLADYAFVFQQYSGLQVQLVNVLCQTHPVRKRRDIENYLARLELVAGQMDEGVAQAKKRAARGILPPRFILTVTIQQFDRFLAAAPHENVLVASLAARTAKVKDLSAADHARSDTIPSAPSRRAACCSFCDNTGEETCPHCSHDQPAAERQGLHYNALAAPRRDLDDHGQTTCVKKPHLRAGVKYGKILALKPLTGEVGLGNSRCEGSEACYRRCSQLQNRPSKKRM